MWKTPASDRPSTSSLVAHGAETPILPPQMRPCIYFQLNLGSRSKKMQFALAVCCDQHVFLEFGPCRNHFSNLWRTKISPSKGLLGLLLHSLHSKWSELICTYFSTSWGISGRCSTYYSTPSITSQTKLFCHHANLSRHFDGRGTSEYGAWNSTVSM